MTGLLILAALTGLAGEWQTYTNTNYISDIAGTDSVLYLATNGGLQSFTIADQTYQEVFTNTEGLPLNVLLCAARDKQGNIWLGTDGGGLVVFEPVARRFLVYPPDRMPLKINCLSAVGDTILVGTNNGVFIVVSHGTPVDFDDDELFQFQAPRLLSNTVFSVGSGAGFLWVGSNRGADRISPDLDSIAGYAHTPAGDSVKAILQYRDSVYIATEAGIGRYNDSGFVAVALFGQRHNVRRMVAYHDSLFLALDAGLWRYNGAGFDNVWSGDVRTVCSLTDLWLSFGWVPEAGGGLARIHPDGAQNGYFTVRLASNNVACATSDARGELYACHYLTAWGYRWISHRIPDGTWEQPHDTLINPITLSLDSRNRLWLGHFALDGGVSSYDPADSSWQVIQWGPSTLRNVICALGIDRFDTKWVYSQQGNVTAIDSSGVQETFNNIPGVTPPSGGGYDFAFDQRDRVWFGTMNGVGMIDYQGTLHDPDDDSLTFYTTYTNVPSVAIDLRDRLWIATSQGAGVLEDGQFKYYTTSNSGILSNNVSRVRVDSWGNIWLLTEKGLSLFDPETGRWSQPDNNRGMIPNLTQRTGFYTWLDLNEDRRTVLVGTLAGLTQFTFTVPSESSLQAIAIYPNPYVAANGSGTITFDRLPDNSFLQVMTLNGDLVAEASHNPGASFYLDETYHKARWNTQNRSNRNVGSGIYLVVLTTPTRRAVTRLAIVR